MENASMPKARELRQRAWDLLAEEGRYWRYLLAHVVLSLLALVGLVTALAVLAGYVGSVTVLPQALGGGVPAAGAPSPAVVAGSFAAATAAVTLIVYVLGFVKWGKAAMAIAAVRKGLRVTHAFSGWGHGWQMAGVILLAGTYASLWALLFIVPGIMAAFSYALAPYLKVDHPDWSAGRCISESKRLMAGHRWRLMCFTFSYIGWYALVVMLHFIPGLGWAQIFLEPYVGAGHAAFYEDLLDRAS